MLVHQAKEGLHGNGLDQVVDLMIILIVSCVQVKLARIQCHQFLQGCIPAETAWLFNMIRKKGLGRQHDLTS